MSEPFPNLVPAPQRWWKSRVHLIATGLLILMAVLYACGYHLQQHHHIKWGYLRAFAEAGMIGALADWFAVIALFRHPLGQKWIPHTAIIPQRKNDIANNLAEFIETQFLSPEQIRRKLGPIDFATHISAWLNTPENAHRLSTKLAHALPTTLDAVDDADIRQFVKDQLSQTAQRLPLSQLLSRILTILVQNERHHELFNQALKIAKTVLDNNGPFIESRIESELQRLPSAFGLRNLLVRSIAEKIVRNLQSSLDEILQNPQHPVWQQFHDYALDAITQLQHSPQWQERVDLIRSEILHNQALSHSLENIWDGLKASLEQDLQASNPRIIEYISSTLQHVFKPLTQNHPSTEKFSDWIREVLFKVITSNSSLIGHLIRETAQQWSGKEMAEKLEAQVGADLQFIRINGTLVGGLVGILLHFLTQMIWH